MSPYFNLRFKPWRVQWLALEQTARHSSGVGLDDRAEKGPVFPGLKFPYSEMSKSEVKVLKAPSYHRRPAVPGTKSPRSHKATRGIYFMTRCSEALEKLELHPGVQGGGGLVERPAIDLLLTRRLWKWCSSEMVGCSEEPHSGRRGSPVMTVAQGTRRGCTQGSRSIFRGLPGAWRMFRGITDAYKVGSLQRRT